MEIKEWRRLAIQSVTLLLMVVLVSVCFRDVFSPEEQTVMAANRPDASKEQQPSETKSDGRNVRKTADTYIQIRKNAQMQDISVRVTNDIMDGVITAEFEGMTAENLSENQIVRFAAQTVRSGSVSKNETLLRKLTVSTKMDKASENTVTRVRFYLKDVYESEFYEDETAYYICLAKPKDIYDHVVVIDAGHGGMDEGTCSVNEKYYEKVYTLLISRRLEALLSEQGVKVYLTREKDEWVSKKKRTDFANQVNADVFLSVHCNASSEGDTTAYGLETLYSERKAENASMTNKKLAQIVLDEMVQSTKQRRRGVIQRENLYLLHHAKVPAVIVEAGYMTNKKDLRVICRKEGQEQLAQGICNGILKILEE